MKHFWLLLLGTFSLFSQSEDTIQTKAPTIRFTNGIKPAMLEYTFLKIGYRPDHFKISINDQELQPGSSLEIPVDQKTVRVRYDFSFAKGWRTGAKEVLFELAKDQREYNLEFSWHNHWRVFAQGAKPQKAIRLKFNS